LCTSPNPPRLIRSICVILRIPPVVHWYGDFVLAFLAGRRLISSEDGFNFEEDEMGPTGGGSRSTTDSAKAGFGKANSMIDSGNLGGGEDRSKSCGLEIARVEKPGIVGRPKTAFRQSSIEVRQR